MGDIFFVAIQAAGMVLLVPVFSLIVVFSLTKTCKLFDELIRTLRAYSAKKREQLQADQQGRNAKNILQRDLDNDACPTELAVYLRAVLNDVAAAREAGGAWSIRQSQDSAHRLALFKRTSPPVNEVTPA